LEVDQLKWSCHPIKWVSSGGGDDVITLCGEWHRSANKSVDGSFSTNDKIGMKLITRMLLQLKG
jgi:hypothetical protein